jgi:RimJ/RimL family protein N-acetyltransferase
MDFWLGERVRLRGVEPADAEFFWQWNHDTEMNAFLDQVWVPGSLEAQRQWAAKAAVERPADDHYRWVIETLEGQPVGQIDTHHCDRRVGALMYGIAVRQEYQRQGYASEAVRIVLQYFFDELRYQKATVGVHSNNVGSIGLHERLGFQQEGRVRRVVYMHGAYHDELYYGLTTEEFHERHAGWLARRGRHADIS